MPKTAVIFGGISSEHDISVSTGLQATHLLDDCLAIYWDKTGRFHLVDRMSEPGEFADGPPRKAKPLGFSPFPGEGFTSKSKTLGIDVVVVCLHGGPGEDGTLQGAFDLAQMRYTGPGQLASALGMDKLLFAAAMAQAGLSALPRLRVTKDVNVDFPGPFILKPRFGGSSIGIEIVADWSTALDLLEASPHLRLGAVVEPFLEGCRDLQIAVRTHPTVQLSAIEEPIQAAGGLYSYEQKYLAWGESGRIARKLPAPLDPALENELREAAELVTEVVGLRSVARIDFLEHEGALYVNEVNTIPGSLAAYLFIDPVVSRKELLEGMIAEAMSEPPRRFSTAGADGSALRNAGSVASKLA